MIRLGAEAPQQVADLLLHYARRERLEAGRNLLAAIDQAAAQIEHDPKGGLPAPRPYPSLAREGRAWIKTGRYWISYMTSPEPVIVAVFHEASDIPGRSSSG